MSDVETLPYLPHEKEAHGVTPYFKFYTGLNVAQSEDEGREVWDAPIQVVEIRFAGDRNYAPVFPVDAMHKKVGNRVYTYAEMYADQYRQFIDGDGQTAGGTALEALHDYGITPAQLSVCRAVKIYSIEALEGLEGSPDRKSLGMSVNPLMEMARRWRADQSRHSGADIEALKAQIAELQALIPATYPEPAEVAEIIEAADDEFEALSDGDIKTMIADKTGSRPRGNPSRETLIKMVQDAA